MPERARILVAEDNRCAQRLIEALLESLGYQVDVRDTGRATVEACLSGVYGAILMDGYMPELDGFEAAREIRRLERGRRTPIMGLTATLKDSDRERCLAAGMDDCLSKPVSRKLLAATMARWAPVS